MPFRLPTRVEIAPGSLARLEPLARGFEASRALLVHDPGLLATPWPARARAALISAGCAVEVADDIEANPRHTTVNAWGERARSGGIGLVVGLGGGSALDAAKAIAMLAANPGGCELYEGRNRFAAKPVPFLAVPTTCGTGSEVTWVSVITRLDQRRKISVKGDGMFPDHALIDANLLATLPPHLIAWTSVDALTHAVEAATCSEANPVSDALAEKACALIFRYLRRAAADPKGDAEAREAILRAATLAGMAFGNADVAGVHCLSESLGGLFDVPHGLANAILLAPVMRSHREAARAKLEALHAAVFPQDAPKDPAEAFLQRIEELVSDLKIPSFGSLEIPREAFAEIAKQSEGNNSNPSNPRAMTAADYLELLERLS
ncbi:MAG: iron-containing alcohol dehydrogenase [Planctomycetes bacterium]|nr:iron-containing alcohol dehydrogenase [Planctomycetota bacterium]